jgi:hypothetical protein
MVKPVAYLDTAKLKTLNVPKYFITLHMIKAWAAERYY